MRIDDISIKPAVLLGRGGREWTLHVESAGYTFDGTFDNLLSFMHCVSECIKYFGQVHGLLLKKPDGTYKSAVKQQ